MIENKLPRLRPLDHAKKQAPDLSSVPQGQLTSDSDRGLAAGCLSGPGSGKAEGFPSTGCQENRQTLPVGPCRAFQTDVEIDTSKLTVAGQESWGG